MNILITPPADQSQELSLRTFTQSLVELLNGVGHKVSICSGNNLNYRNVAIFNAIKPHVGLFRGKESYPTYEEELYNKGIFDTGYLKQDVQDVRNACNTSQAELIIDLGRLSSPIVSRLESVRCFSFLHAGMFKNRPLPKTLITGLNETLSFYHLEQLLSLSELYKNVERRLVFSPISIQPFKKEISITRLGSLYPLPINYTPSKKVFVCITSTTTKPKKWDKVIKESFLNAPYDVDVFYPTSVVSKMDNLQFFSSPNHQLASQAGVCINDGSEGIFNYCITVGVPQLIIHDGSWQRAWNANAATRMGVGIAIMENTLSVESIYENYRRLVSDDYYKNQALQLSKEVTSLGDITDLLKLI